MYFVKYKLQFSDKSKTAIYPIKYLTTFIESTVYTYSVALPFTLS